MTHFVKKMLATSLLAGCFAVAHAQQMPPIPIDNNVRIGKLDNGMTYYIRHNQLPEKRADFYIAQKVGSILEEENQRGLAHFLEHMCFNGTKSYPGNSLIKYLESIGVKFGENLNAYTSIDETVYNISNVPVVRDGVIDSCLLILHDWANDLSLTDKDIDDERGVIHEEWRTRQGPTIRMYEKAFPIAYPGSKYANRLPIGLIDVIDKFPYEVLRNYYKEWYRPDLQGLVIVGDFDVDKMEAKIKSLFSTIKPRVNPSERKYFPVPDTKETIVAIAKDKEQTVPSAYISYKHDAIPDSAKTKLDYMVYEYMKYMTGTMLTARLSELKESPTPPFIDAGADDGNYLISKTKKAFTGVVYTKEDGMENGIATLTREIERMKKFGFTASEYSRAKANYLKFLESEYNERSKTKNEQYVNKYVRHFIDNEPIPGVENEYAIMNQIAPNIPVEAINSIIPTLVTDSNCVVCIFMPEKEGMKYPTKESVLAAIENVKKENITPYVDKVSDEPLIKNKPTAGKITKTEKGAFGSTLLTLSNGAKVIIKQTDFKADEILLSAYSPGGSSLFADNEIININNLNGVISAGGLGNFSPTNLEKVLAGKKVSLNASIDGTTENVNGNCSPKDMESMLQLLYLSFTAPRKDMDAFTSFKTRMKASLENQEANPAIALVDTLRSAIYKNHPRSIRMKADMVEKIDYDKIMNMYKDRYKDASDFTFIIVGNVDIEKAKPLIETYIASLPSINRKESFKDNKMDMRKGAYKNIFSKKMETPKSTVVVLYNGAVPYTLKNSVMMSIFSQILDIVYTEEIREKEGGTYGVGTYGEISKYPKEVAYLQISFDTNPDRRTKMTQIVTDQINKFVAEGPSEVNLNKVKEFMLKKHNENLKENSYWMNLINEYYWNKTDMNDNYETLINSITAKDIKEFAKSFIGQKNVVEVSMTDETKIVK